MLRIFFLGQLLFFSIHLMAQDKAKLIYFADPMCSWCYGFSPELTKVVDQLGDTIEFEMVMGGLRPYNTQTMTELGDFLKEHWEHVHEASKQPFNYSILKDSTIVYDTEPACRAVMLMRQLKPGKEFSYFKKIQTAFYKNNKDPNATSTYVELLDGFGVDNAVFEKSFESEEMKALIKEDFQYSANLGVRGYPTLVLQKGTDLFLLSNGYTKAEIILEKISKTLIAN